MIINVKILMAEKTG